MERLVELIDDHRREVGRVGLEADPARERQQDLPRVVLLAEEALDRATAERARDS